jgi:wyosine [tRNA(Phe)-imidazoG37] synthetase (radical SAM superfamily)
VGKTTNIEMTRKSFVDPYRIVEEVLDKATKTEHIDYITFSGSGEPTLNLDIGKIIEEIKNATTIPVAVITSML